MDYQQYSTYSGYQGYNPYGQYSGANHLKVGKLNLLKIINNNSYDIQKPNTVNPMTLQV